MAKIAGFERREIPAMESDFRAPGPVNANPSEDAVLGRGDFSIQRFAPQDAEAARFLLVAAAPAARYALFGARNAPDREAGDIGADGAESPGLRFCAAADCGCPSADR
jgi:hypothetical protein